MMTFLGTVREPGLRRMAILLFSGCNPGELFGVYWASIKFMLDIHGLQTAVGLMWILGGVQVISGPTNLWQRP